MGNHLSMPISASGSCQVWRPWNAVSLALPIVDSCGPLLFYLVHFNLTLLLPSPEHNSLSRCFLVQRRPQQVGRVKCDEPAKQYVFPCQLLIVVVLCCFIQSISHLTLLLFSSSSKTSNKHLNSFFSSFSCQCIFIRTQSSTTVVSNERCVVAHGYP